MPISIKVSNTWRNLAQAHVKVSNSWRPCVNIHVNVNGTWKSLYHYWWDTGSWSTCSAKCGGGTQTRSVTCIREHTKDSRKGSNWKSMDDSFCTKNGLSKPSTSQTCNTQGCTKKCKYYANGAIYNCGNSYWEVFIPHNGPESVRMSWSDVDKDCSTTEEAYSSGLVNSIVKNGYVYSPGEIVIPRAYGMMGDSRIICKICRIAA